VGRQPDAAGDDEHVIAAELVDREPVAERTADREGVAHVLAVDRGRHPAYGTNDDVERPLARGRAGDADGDLAVAHDTDLEDLPGLEHEGLSVGHLQREVLLTGCGLVGVEDSGLAREEQALLLAQAFVVVCGVMAHDVRSMIVVMTRTGSAISAVHACEQRPQPTHAGPPSFSFK